MGFDASYAQAVASANATLSDSDLGGCVRCPPCLRSTFDGCVGKPVRRHKDCIIHPLMCHRHVYECPGAGIFFSHPPLSRDELSSLYRRKVSSRRLGINSERFVSQAAFVMAHAGHRLLDDAVVVEIGCNQGYLLQRFGGPRRRLYCFEPNLNRAAHTATLATLRRTGSADAAIIESAWDGAALLKATGGRAVDLFLSSHTLEHVQDGCGFLSDLHAHMAPGGAVFTEVPNHSARYLQQLKHSGGYFHLLFPTARGLLLLLENAGFQLGALRTMRSNAQTGANGMWLRSLVFRSNRTANAPVAWPLAEL